jgi:hypothetical protein
VSETVPGHPGDVSWHDGHGPARVLGACPHACEHRSLGVVGWGPDADRYELVACEGCGGTCRAWVNGRGAVTTAWLHVAA